MKLLLLLCGPAVMILIGLQGVGSVPVTFVLFYSWLLLVPLVDMLLRKEKKLSQAMRDCGLVFRRKNMYSGMSTGIFFFLAILLGGYFFHSHVFHREKLQSLLIEWNFSGDHLIWLILILLSVNPFLEELYWRGYIFHRLANTYKQHTAIFFTASFYTLYHFLSVIPLFAWPYNVFMVVPVFAAGLIWGYMRARSDAVAGGIVSHILADGGIMAVYLLFLT